VENHVSIAIQSARRIGVDLANDPFVTVKGLPREWRIHRIHSDALHPAFEMKRKGA
jgi:hypothetical protein